MARQHKIGQFVPVYQGGLLAQAFDDSFTLASIPLG